MPVSAPFVFVNGTCRKSRGAAVPMPMRPAFSNITEFPRSMDVTNLPIAPTLPDVSGVIGGEMRSPLLTAWPPAARAAGVN